LNIRNLCQDITLTSPVYFIYGGEWNVAPEQEIDVNVVMRSHLEVDSGRDMLEGVLIYKIQRQQAEYDEFVQNESKSIQLLIAWRVEHMRVLHVRALLVEHDSELDEDKLKRLQQKYWQLLKVQIDSTKNWLLNGTTVLGTTIKVMNGGYRWDISIAEEIEDAIERPLWIDTERWVAIMLMIFPRLMYTVSLVLCNTRIITVHNQYPDIELVSPVYSCNCGTYYEYPFKRMGDSTMMKIDLRFDLEQDESSGILMYEVRRKRNINPNHQSNVDPIFTEAIEEALKMIRLLITWKIKRSEGPEIKILLVEYSESVLNEDKLAQLYDKVNNMHFTSYNFYGDTWLVYDSTTLKTEYHVMQEKGLESRIIVSEGFVDQDTIRPIWIDPES
jgi:hypothetical protein